MANIAKQARQHGLMKSRNRPGTEVHCTGARGQSSLFFAPTPSKKGPSRTGRSTDPDAPLSLRRCEKIREQMKTTSSPRPSPPEEERGKDRAVIFSQLLTGYPSFHSIALHFLVVQLDAQPGLAVGPGFARFDRQRLAHD